MTKIYETYGVDSLFANGYLIQGTSDTTLYIVSFYLEQFPLKIVSMLCLVF